MVVISRLGGPLPSAPGRFCDWKVFNGRVYKRGLVVTISSGRGTLRHLTHHLTRQERRHTTYLHPRERRGRLGHHTLKELDLRANWEGVLGAGHDAVPIALDGSVLALEFVVARSRWSCLGGERGICWWREFLFRWGGEEGSSSSSKFVENAEINRRI